jgi:ADP-ribose pyrophosphatase
VTKPNLAPWAVLETRDVFSAPPYITVQTQRVLLPDGREVDDFHRVVMPDYSLVLPETVDGRYIVLRQYKHGVGDVSLTFPAGTLNAGEDPLTAAKRELLEETGYEAGSWRYYGRYVTHANSFSNAANLFTAAGCRKVAEPNSGDLEDMELLLMTRQELFDAARRGEFKLTTQMMILALATHPVLAETVGEKA